MAVGTMLVHAGLTEPWRPHVPLPHGLSVGGSAGGPGVRVPTGSTWGFGVRSLGEGALKAFKQSGAAGRICGVGSLSRDSRGHPSLWGSEGDF